MVAEYILYDVLMLIAVIFDKLFGVVSVRSDEDLEEDMAFRVGDFDGHAATAEK